MGCEPRGDWTTEDKVPEGYIRLYVTRNGENIPLLDFGLTEDRLLRVTWNDKLSMTAVAARFVEALKAHLEIWEQR